MALLGFKGKRESGYIWGYVALQALRLARHSQLGSRLSPARTCTCTNARHHLQRHASLSSLSLSTAALAIRLLLALLLLS